MRAASGASANSRARSLTCRGALIGARARRAAIYLAEERAALLIIGAINWMTQSFCPNCARSLPRSLSRSLARSFFGQPFPLFSLGGRAARCRASCRRLADFKEIFARALHLLPGARLVSLVCVRRGACALKLVFFSLFRLLLLLCHSAGAPKTFRLLRNLLSSEASKSSTTTTTAPEARQTNQ